MGCLIKSFFTLVLVLVIAVFAFMFRDQLRAAWKGLRGETATEQHAPSQALADEAALKMTELRSGERESIALSEMELQSLLMYKYRELLPAFVDSPNVELNGDRIQVKGRVPIDRLPQVTELGQVASFLPDTTELEVTGRLLPLSGRRVALAVDQVKAARIPLPQRLISGALDRLGRKAEEGLPADAIAVRLPPGADAVYVRNDSIFFMSRDSN